MKEARPGKTYTGRSLLGVKSYMKISTDQSTGFSGGSWGQRAEATAGSGSELTDFWFSGGEMLRIVPHAVW